jgi:4-hydroxy-tetrahydrodipicolinate synthase
MPLPTPLRGIVTPLITPLSADLSLDTESLDRLIEHVLAGGVRGLFLLGTSGEGPSLSMAVQHEVIKRASTQVRGRAAVLVGITHSSMEESLALARRAAEVSADAVVTAGPLYMPVSQAQLVDWTGRLADSSPLPVFLYNMPSHAHVSFDEDTVVRLAGHANIRGLKDSGGQIMYLHGLHSKLSERPDFTLLVGPEEMTAACVLLGIHGGVNGGSNLFPLLYVRLYEAAANGDLALVRTLHEQVMKVSRNLYSLGSYSSGYLQGVKCAAGLLGLCQNILAPPYRALEGVSAEKLRQNLAELIRSGQVPAGHPVAVGHFAE